MAENWQQIASSVYPLTKLRLLEVRRHFSEHFFLEAEQGRFVLSCSAAQADRMAKGYQFSLMETLRDNGFGPVALPLQTGAGHYCHLQGRHWWVLRQYIEADAAPPWTAPALVEAAAQTLAALHRAGTGFSPLQRAESERPDLGWYYLPARRWPAAAAEIARAFPWATLPAADAQFVREQVDSVLERAAQVEALCRRFGALTITHQDYRPANLCLQRGKITQVWDFDMALLDYFPYDVAFAALQYGGRECLFADISLELAGRFLRAYIAASDKGALLEEEGLLRWFLSVAVLRRLLLNYHVGERVRLLRMVAKWDWRSANGVGG